MKRTVHSLFLVYLIFSFKTNSGYAGFDNSPHNIMAWFNYSRGGFPNKKAKCEICHGYNEFIHFFKYRDDTSNTYGRIAILCWKCHGNNLFLGRTEPVVYNEIFKPLDKNYKPSAGDMDSHPSRGTGSGSDIKILKNTYIPYILEWPYTGGWNDGKNTEDIECTTCHNVHDWNSRWDTRDGKRKFLREAVYYESGGMAFNFCANCHFIRDNETGNKHLTEIKMKISADMIKPFYSAEGLDEKGVDRGGRAVWDSASPPAGEFLGPRLYNNVIICQTCHTPHGAARDTDTAGLRKRSLLAINSKMDSTENILLVLENARTQLFYPDLNRELLYASGKGDFETVKALLEKGADANTEDRKGNTVLIRAVLSGNSKTVKILLEKGADANVKDMYGNTVLICAIQSGKIDIVKILVEKGADVNAKGPLFFAVWRKEDIMRFLLENGADVNAKNKDGATVLMYAVQAGGRIDIVKILLEKGADVNVKDNYGLTIFDYADRRHDITIINALRGNK
ncbi:MAG: ankyrin repeat domain-containing protein [bacterium]